MTSPKAVLRNTCLERRLELAAQHPTAGRDVGTRVTELLGTAARGKIVAGYMTLEDELDCRPALAMLHAAGAALALPVAGARSAGLVFRAWQPGARLENGPFGTVHPLPEAPAVEPDILLVPLIAFDAVGHRLGYGAGYYDRSLAILRATRKVVALGLAYDGQEVPAIPAEANDHRLDAVVTDKRVVWFDRSAEARLKASA